MAHHEESNPPTSPSSSRSLLSLIPTPDRNRIAGVKSREQADPYFEREETGDDGETYLVYKAVESFKINVPKAEVCTILRVREGMPQWIQQTETGYIANVFRRWIQPHLPPHIVPSFDHKFEYLLEENGQKKSRPTRRLAGDLRAGYDRVYCSAPKSGCSTTLVTGFEAKALQSLHDQNCTESSMELVVNVQNNCYHRKGMPYGQLRGEARKKAVEDYSELGKAPSEYAKHNADQVDDAAHHSCNRSMSLSRQQCYGLSREAKKLLLKKEGLTNDKLSNIYLANNKIVKCDLTERKSTGDGSEDLLGIVRDFSLLPNFKIHLWDKRSMILYHYLSTTGHLQLFADATGNIVDLPLVPTLTGKLLHTRICAAPLLAMVEGPDANHDRVKRLVAPIVLAECISNKNKAEHMREFYGAFLKDVRDMRMSAATRNPLLVTTDCAEALQTGALEAFVEPGRSNLLNLIEYCNLLLVFLLHFEGLLSQLPAVSDSSQRATRETEIASGILLGLQGNHKLGVFLKECKSHVYRAMEGWIRKSTTKKSLALPSTIQDRFENLFKHWSSQLLDEPSISILIVKMSLIIAMFELEHFELQKERIDDTTVEKEKKSSTEIDFEQTLYTDVRDFIERESRALQLSTQEDVARYVGPQNTKIRREKIFFHGAVIKKAIEFMKLQSSLYLKNRVVMNDEPQLTGKSIATLRLSITYGYGLDTDQEGGFAPWKEGGLEVAAQLPLEVGSKVRNPMYSPEAAAYLRTEWMRKVPIWSHSILWFLESAKPVNFSNNNQLSEAMTKNLKHNQNVFLYASEPATYIKSRWDDSRKSHKAFIQQFSSLQTGIEQIKERMSRKRKRKAEEEALKNLELTPDEIQHMEKAEKGETWRRLTANRSQVESDSVLRQGLTAVFTELGIASNDSARIREVEKHQRTSDNALSTISRTKLASFMSGATGSSGKVHSLNKGHRQLLESFLDTQQKIIAQRTSKETSNDEPTSSTKDIGGETNATPPTSPGGNVFPV